MRILGRQNNRGQAIAEMALLGTLVLIIFVTLLSYIQRSNDEQYTRMESFRRALEKSCTNVNSQGGAGASTSLTLIQNRRLVDLGDNFRKGSPQSFSASSSVFWGVPEVGKQSDQIVLFRVNENEKQLVNDTAFTGVDKIKSGYTTNFSEMQAKSEATTGISNVRTSKLKDTITTEFLDKNGNPIWNVTQGVYRDSSGEYKYSEDAVGTEVERGKRWDTAF